MARFYNHNAPAFGKRVRKLRETLGHSQTDLANSCGLSPSWISHFESGRRTPNVQNLVRLANGLAVTVQELLGFWPQEGGGDHG
jgi:transcriptional regulator with XRE-family HTH domain